MERVVFYSSIVLYYSLFFTFASFHVRDNTFDENRRLRPPLLTRQSRWFVTQKILFSRKDYVHILCFMMLSSPHLQNRQLYSQQCLNHLLSWETNHLQEDVNINHCERIIKRDNLILFKNHMSRSQLELMLAKIEICDMQNAFLKSRSFMDYTRSNRSTRE